MAYINYNYQSFEFGRKLYNELNEDEYNYLKRNGTSKINDLIKINTDSLNPLSEVHTNYFSKKRTIIYFSSILIVILYISLFIDIKADWNYYLAIIPLILSIWLIVYTIQYGLSMFKTFDSFADYKEEMKIYYEHHMKLVQRTNSYPEYCLLVSRASLTSRRS